MRTFKLFILVCTATHLFAQTQVDNKLTPTEVKEKWVLLFDGKTTNGWKSAFKEGFPENGWKIENGVLSVEPSGGKESANGGDIITLKAYRDFDLMVDFKLSDGANSGIKYFVNPKQPDATGSASTVGSAKGLEYQLLDDEKHPDAKNGKDGNRTIGSLYDLISADRAKKVNPIGEWNTARIFSKDNHIEHWLNGQKVVEYTRGDAKFKELIAMSKYKDLPGFGLIEKGYILLQDHGDKVYFKNIKIKELSK